MMAPDINKDLTAVLKRLEELLNQPRAWIDTPYTYLDPEGALYLFQEITGLRDPLPALMNHEQGKFTLDSDAATGLAIPPHQMLNAVLSILNEKIPVIKDEADLSGLSHKYALITGLLQGTHFPDGGLNIEIQFSSVRGLLFYTPEYFSSMIRPVLSHDRFHTLDCQVEALVYLHDKVQRLIFYHQTYGDDTEHSWVPVTPVYIRPVYDETSNKRENG